MFSTSVLYLLFISTCIQGAQSHDQFNAADYCQTVIFCNVEYGSIPLPTCHEFQEYLYKVGTSTRAYGMQITYYLCSGWDANDSSSESSVHVHEQVEPKRVSQQSTSVLSRWGQEKTAFQQQRALFHSRRCVKQLRTCSVCIQVSHRGGGGRILLRISSLLNFNLMLTCRL